jgi:hypothetical protein
MNDNYKNTSVNERSRQEVIDNRNSGVTSMDVY